MTAPSSQPIPLPLVANPGVQKDGTQYRANAHIDGQWIRFKHPWAQKMLGFERIQQGNEEIIVNQFEIPKSESTDVYLGRASSLQVFNITNDGIIGPLIDRTPSSEFFIPNPNNSWSFCTFGILDPDTQTVISYIFAQVCPDRNNVSFQTDGYVFFGLVNDTAPLEILTTTPSTTTPVKCSGAIIAYPPVLVALNNDGCIFYSQAENPFLWVNSSGNLNFKFIGNTKCITGCAFQGYLVTLTLNELIRLNYVVGEAPGDGSFDSGTAATNISILSPDSLVSYRNTLYWLGVGQFYIFNGTVDVIPNDMNHDYFFDNLNLKYKSKVWAIANPQFDELIYFFPALNKIDPTLSSIEPNKSVTYHVGKGTWWNNDWERASGIVLSTYDYPLMASSTLETSLNISGQPVQTYPLWQHEKGFDKVVSGVHFPIFSFIQYPMIDLFTNSPSPETNRLMITQRIEQDFVMSGNLQITILNYKYPQSEPEVIGPFSFSSSVEYIDNVISEGRIVSVLVTSNEVGGYFACGKPLQDIILGSFNPLR